MNYSDLCKAFYIKKGKSGLKNAKTQAKIGEFFFSLVKSPKLEKLLDDYESSSHIRWFTGKNTPDESVWELLPGNFILNDYAKELSYGFNDSHIENVASRFNISLDASDKTSVAKFALAIAKQMKAFIDSEGHEADNIVFSTFNEGMLDVKFYKYIKKASERYNVMKLIGGREVPLEKYFVCNTLGDKQKFVNEKLNIKCSTLDNATVDSIRQFPNEPRDVIKSILIGGGGSGKTLMMQHLFLDAANKYTVTNNLPIFLELRYFLSSETLESFIVKVVSSKDDQFNDEEAKKLFNSGNCTLLMDGLDEIDPSDIGDFQLKLSDFTDHYPKVQIILSSRDCDAVNGIKGYKYIYVWPFNKDQAKALMERFLNQDEKDPMKSRVLSYSASLNQLPVLAFASHPLLLTYMLVFYPNLSTSSFKSNMLFYKKAYEALLSGHDDNKKPYDRVFRSVDDAEQFSKVFREFCALSYEDGITQFDSASFDMYYNKLKSFHEFKNPYKMNAKTFLHDACSTACIMYERELDILYLDPAFQEYLFAEHYLHQETASVKAMGEKLQAKSIDVYGDLNALGMLYEYAEDKVKVAILLPYLDTLFIGKKDDTDRFLSFLLEGFDSINYAVIDSEKTDKYASNSKKENLHVIVPANVPRTIILSFIFKLLNFSQTAQLASFNPSAAVNEFATKAYTGEYFNTEEKRILSLHDNIQEQFDNLELFEKTHNVSNLIHDENNKLVCFGNEYKIDTYIIESDLDRFSNLINILQTEQNVFYEGYKRIYEYYQELKRFQKKNKLM